MSFEIEAGGVSGGEGSHIATSSILPEKENLSPKCSPKSLVELDGLVAKLSSKKSTFSASIPNTRATTRKRRADVDLEYVRAQIKKCNIEVRKAALEIFEKEKEISNSIPSYENLFYNDEDCVYATRNVFD